MALRIAERALRAIIEHARDAAPSECCGLLLGGGDEIVEAVRARNIAAEPTRFLIDPKDHIDARRDARRRGLEVVGFYHSHPHTRADPSETDRALAAYPDHLYLIVSLVSDPPEISLVRLEDGNFRALSFVRVP